MQLNSSTSSEAYLTILFLTSVNAKRNIVNMKLWETLSAVVFAVLVAAGSEKGASDQVENTNVWS